MKLLKAFGRFWYDFIIGDDWKIPVAVVLSLAMLGILLSLGTYGDTALTVLGAILVLTAFSISLAIDTRPERS